MACVDRTIQSDQEGGHHTGGLQAYRNAHISDNGRSTRQQGCWRW